MTNPNSDNYKKEHNQLVFSYLTMRRLVGYLGILTPVILYVSSVVLCDCSSPQRAISQFYHTCVRDIFMVIAGSMAFFLWVYKGYDLIDQIAFKIAGVSILGVGLFPTKFYASNCSLPPIDTRLGISVLHNISAGLFFITLSFIALFLFTKTDKNAQMSDEKRKRNLIFRLCGCVMILCLLAIFAILSGVIPTLQDQSLVFYLQSVALFAFGVAWLVKGQLFYKDIPHS